MKRVSFAVLVATVALVAVPGNAAASTYTNPNLITIPDSGRASPYPSTIAVEGLQGSVADANVTVNSLIHTCSSDLDLLLVGPGGQESLLLSQSGTDSCTGDPQPAVTFTLDDEAASTYPCENVSGTFKPTNDACFEDSGDLDPPAPPGPYVASLSTQDGGSPNGAWNLFVFDRFTGDEGSIAGGWTLDLLTDATCSGRPATLTGTAGDEELVGTEGDDVILGFDGRDTINGLGGNDTICGGSKKDTLRGGSGKDKVVGQSGQDKVLGNGGKDKLLGKGGPDKLNGGPGKDVCKGGKKDDTAKKCEVEKSI